MLKSMSRYLTNAVSEIMANINPGSKINHPRMRNDKPPKEDGLDRKGYVDAFSEIAKTCETPAVIGLYGRWGVGKTSLMRQIEGRLEADDSVRTVWFDPWQHQFDEHPVLSLMHAMVSTLELGSDGKDKLKTIAWALGKSIVRAITDVDPTDIEKALARDNEANFLLREERVRLYDRFKELLVQAQKSKGSPQRRIVFFIDDLDRCLPAHTLTVLESLKLFLNFDGCVYFLGADRDALESSIRHHYQHAKLDYVGYLDKIVQIPFDIPPIARQSMDNFIESLLPAELTKAKMILELGLGNNPRSVKRFINNLSLNYILAKAAFGRLEPSSEADPIVLATLLLIQVRNSDLSLDITRDPELLALLVSSDEDGKSRRKNIMPKELVQVLELEELEFISKLGEKELVPYVTLTDASPIKSEEALDAGDSDDDEPIEFTAAAPQLDASGFLSDGGLKQVVVNSGSIRDEKSISIPFLLFRTRKQKTWLVTTNEEIFCLLDSENTRRSGRVIRWRQPLTQATPVGTYVSIKDTPLIDIGSRKRWLYSRSLHPDRIKLIREVESIIKKAISG